MVTHIKYGGKGKINSGLDIREGFIKLYYLSRLMNCIKFVFVFFPFIVLLFRKFGKSEALRKTM